MKDFLVQYSELCKDREQSLHNEEEHIITLLDALVGQQTRNDLFKKLSANQVLKSDFSLYKFCMVSDGRPLISLKL